MLYIQAQKSGPGARAQDSDTLVAHSGGFYMYKVLARKLR